MACHCFLSLYEKSTIKKSVLIHRSVWRCHPADCLHPRDARHAYPVK
ncbi:hypothetical protein [Moraxella lacunata]